MQPTDTEEPKKNPSCQSTEIVITEWRIGEQRKKMIMAQLPRRQAIVLHRFGRRANGRLCCSNFYASAPTTEQFKVTRDDFRYKWRQPDGACSPFVSH